LCNIELIKLTKDYTPHPVQYYDLINCGEGEDYHTTSDLNYNMYAYIGNYVNIYTGSSTTYTSIGCFQVQLGQPNSTYDYEKVFIGSGYTQSGVNIYNNCGCSGRTQMIVVQEEYPEPTTPPIETPTPTPTPSATVGTSPTPTATPNSTPTTTPTPSSTRTTLCYEYSFVPDFGQVLEWLDCAGNFQSATVSGGVPYFINCAQQGTVSGVGITTQGTPCS
jgi:hypothetical protein